MAGSRDKNPKNKNGNKEKTFIKIFVFFVVLMAVLAAFFMRDQKEGPSEDDTETSSVIESDTEGESSQTEIPDDAGKDTVRFLCTGDDLIHQRLIDSGLREGGTRNYDHLYEHIKDDVAGADIAYCNQETIFVADENSYSGYPSFGTPMQVGDALNDAGFDIVSHATNHAFDKGETGVLDSITFWRENHPEMLFTGIHDSAEDAGTVKTLEKNGIMFSFLNYTYGLNGLELPSGKGYLVDLLSEEKIRADVEKAKGISDCVVVFLHCGTEYVYEPDDSTYKWVQLLLECHVDICIASHPHVLEPYGYITGEDGHTMFTAYSMGNMISTQDERPRLLGGLLKFNVEKDRTSGDIEVTSPVMEPLYTMVDDASGVYTVYKLDDLTDDMLRSHSLYEGDEPLTVHWIKELFNEIMNTDIDQPGAVTVERPYK